MTARTMNADGLSRQIRDMRVAMGHTQLSLASAIGAHVQTVSQWERGRKKPLPVFFNSIRDLYQVWLKGVAA